MKNLIKLIKNKNIDGYIIPKNDEYFNEYIDSSNDRLKYITNFSGSAGFAIVFKNKGYLFVDGRYTRQAKLQTKKKFKVFTIPKNFPSSVFKKKKLVIGYDPKLHTEIGLKRIFYGTNCSLIPINENIIDKIWKRKKTSINKNLYFIEQKYSGQSAKQKITMLTKILKKNNTDLLFVSAFENIAWLLNIRGKDSNYSPIANAYLLLDQKNNLYFFCNSKKIGKDLKKKLGNKISFFDLSNVENFLKRIRNKKVHLDSQTCSLFYQRLTSKNNVVVLNPDPIYNLKSLKNKIEIKNIKKSHIADGAALTKFIIWLKNNFKKRKISEIMAEKKLLEFRKKNKNFKFLSFPTISGSGPNSSIIHYKANKESNRVLKKGDIYLVDSGGQYFFGTTDVTRTLSLENNKKNIKEIYTRVLKGHIAVVNFKFKKNTVGSSIDKVARKYLKEINLDYPHGTGHGVGYFLNVHEGPQALSKFNKVRLKEGMVLSNEPGYYKDGEFGIRIENLVVIKKLRNNLKFENLTMAPIDKTLIVKKLLNKFEVKWLNSYHEEVYNKLKRTMNKQEITYLKLACSNI